MTHAGHIGMAIAHLLWLFGPGELKIKFLGLAKTILYGTVNGKRRCRQKKRGEDNTKGWTGMDFETGVGLLRSHLWYPHALAKLWDNLD